MPSTPASTLTPTSDDSDLVIYEFDRTSGAAALDFLAFSVHCVGVGDLSAATA